MLVRIVTDSGCDLPGEMIKSLDISVVPIYIYFGKDVYRDGIDISTDELYRRLSDDKVHPTTTQPLPVDFARIYEQLGKETDKIVSIHLSHKVSGTLNSAVQGKHLAKSRAQIEIIDSYSISTGLGIVTLAAAREAKAEGSIEQVVKKANEVISNIKLYGVLETLKYLLAGGRITRTKAVIGGLLNVKPVLTMHDGEIIQYGMVRSFQKGMDKLYKMIADERDIEEIAIVHSTIPEQAIELKSRIKSIVPENKIIMSRLGAGLGVHGGPGTLFIVIRRQNSHY